VRRKGVNLTKKGVNLKIPFFMLLKLNSLQEHQLVFKGGQTHMHLGSSIFTFKQLYIQKLP
jgi:hypothetical protein